MKKNYLCLALLFLVTSIFAQNDADIEHSFGIYPGFNGNINKVVVDSNGKFVICGDFTTYNGLIKSKIISINSDGTLNNNINFGEGFNSTVNELVIQPDGKIIAGGIFSNYRSSNHNFLVRINTDGSVDNSFIPVVELSQNEIVSFNNLLLQLDGKIIINIKYRDLNNGQIKNLFRRLNTDGTIDTSFNLDSSLISNTLYNIEIKSIALTSNNQLLVAWYSNPIFGGTVTSGLMRLNEDGSKDESFVANQSYGASFVSVLPNGKIMLSANGDIIRLNYNGSIDNTFEIPSTLTKHIWDVSSILVQQDGKCIVGGKGLIPFSINGIEYNHIFRITATGEIDTTFNIGSGFNDAVNTLALDAIGRIIVGGTFNNYKNSAVTKLIRMDVNANIDLNYGQGNGFDNEINSINIQNDGKILLGGNFNHYNNQTENKIIRLNIDGTKDTYFNTGNGFDKSILTTQIQPDGKIIVGGGFENYNGNNVKNLVRLNTDGTLDNLFNIEKRFNGPIYTTATQMDGRILAGGFFFPNTGFYDNLKRFNIDGSLDSSFNIGSGFNNTTRKIYIQSDGKIIIGGSFTQFNGVTRNRLVRLNTNGSLDTSFLIGNSLTSGTVYDIVQQADGKIILAGDFHYSNSGNERDYLIRLNQNGTLDTSFAFSPDFLEGLKSILVEPDGKILLGLTLYFKDTDVRIGVARLNTNGSLDTSFDNNLGFINDFLSGSTFKINGLAIQNDGKILLGGLFTYYQTEATSSLVRLKGISTLANTHFEIENSISIFPNPSNDVINISSKNGIFISGYEIFDITGKKIESHLSFENIINIRNLENGTYFLKLQTSKGILVRKIIKK